MEDKSLDIQELATRGEQDSEKFVTMPQKDEMLSKLREAGIFGMTPQIDKTFEVFVTSVAGIEKNVLV